MCVHNKSKKHHNAPSGGIHYSMQCTCVQSMHYMHLKPWSLHTRTLVWLIRRTHYVDQYPHGTPLTHSKLTPTRGPLSSKIWSYKELENLRTKLHQLNREFLVTLTSFLAMRNTHVHRQLATVKQILLQIM